MKKYFANLLLIICLAHSCLTISAQDVSNDDLKACAEYKDKSELNFYRWKSATREYAKLEDTLKKAKQDFVFEILAKNDSITVLNKQNAILSTLLADETSKLKQWRTSFLVTISLFVLVIVLVVLVIQRFNFSPKNVTK